MGSDRARPCRYVSAQMSGRKTVPIPDRHSAHPPGKAEWKAEWKAEGNRLTAKELAELTRDVGREVRLRPSWCPSIRVL